MKIFITLLCWFIWSHCNAQFGVISKTSEATDGLTLFHPNGSTDTYLINNDGVLVHKWIGSLKPGVAVYLLENGQLLRTGRVEDEHTFAGGVGGSIELVNWDGSIHWSYVISNANQKLHHDVQYLPNGNILAIVWEVKTNEEAVDMGRNPSTLENGIWPDKIIEIKPIGSDNAEIVWEWNAWDHLIQDFDETKSNFGVIADNPGKINVNYDTDTDPDWNHFNAISYNEELDQILISVPTFDEVWIIDHSTTTEEAKTGAGGNSGKGGDLIYRWGNPITYNRGVIEDKKLFYQHNPSWLFEDNTWKILVFNNGRNRPDGSYSSVDKILLPYENGAYTLQNDEPYGPLNNEYSYTSPNKTDLFSSFVSSAQQLPNNNILICSGVTGDVFEINEEEEIVWQYKVPIGASGDIFCLNEEGALPGFVFRAEQFSTDFNGLGELSNFGLLQGDGCTVLNSVRDLDLALSSKNKLLYINSPQSVQKVSIHNLQGIMMGQYSIDTNNSTISLKNTPSGIYIITLQFRDNSTSRQKFLLKD